MSKKAQKSLFIFLLIITATIGLVYILLQPQDSNDENLNIEIQNVTEETSSNSSETGYLFSRPSNGPLTKTKKITLNYHENNLASANIPADHENKLRAKQNVILFDKAKTVMPLGGEVKTIEPKDDLIEIGIQLPAGTKTELLSNEAEIITSEIIASQRYPLTALQRDKNGNTFVWVAEKTNNKNKYKAIKTWVDKPTIGRNHFIAGKPINAYSLVILKPDKKIKDKKIYGMTQVKFKAPLKSPIKQAYYDYRTYSHDKFMEEQAKKLKKCREQKTPEAPSGDATGSCSTNSANAKPTSPEEIFQSILNRQPRGSSGSCGGSTASCGK